MTCLQAAVKVLLLPLNISFSVNISVRNEAQTQKAEAIKDLGQIRVFGQKVIRAKYVSFSVSVWQSE